VVTADGQLDTRPASGGVSGAELRARWGVRDARSLYVLADPSQRSLLAFSAGDDVSALLGTNFFLELQSRYGNMFYVRDNGADEAVLNATRTLVTCLRRAGGCAAVPGVPSEGAWLTLSPSVFAGAVAGYAARQPPSGPVTSSLGWLLVTAPLWAFLLGAFGIAPVLLRSDDAAALVPNLGAFALAAGLLYLTPIFGASPASKPRRGDDDEQA
jgi:hypothetical protein